MIDIRDRLSFCDSRVNQKLCNAVIRHLSVDVCVVLGLSSCNEVLKPLVGPQAVWPKHKNEYTGLIKAVFSTNLPFLFFFAKFYKINNHASLLIHKALGRLDCRLEKINYINK